MKFEWKRDTREYSSGEILYLGRWNVGSAFYDGGKSKDDPKKQIATCSLPGIKRNLGSFEKEKEAKDRVENAVKHWIKESGL